MQYLDIARIIELHDDLIALYGGLGGVQNGGQLDSVLNHIQNDDLYPTMIDKATHLMFGIIMFHCFTDGNKRTGIASTSLFLWMNGIELPDFESKMEDIAVGVAKWLIDKNWLRAILESIFTSFWYA